MCITCTILSGSFYLNRAGMTALKFFSSEKQRIIRQLIVIKYLDYFLLSLVFL